jgi:hypothetical protein
MWAIEKSPDDTQHWEESARLELVKILIKASDIHAQTTVNLICMRRYCDACARYNLNKLFLYICRFQGGRINTTGGVSGGKGGDCEAAHSRGG